MKTYINKEEDFKTLKTLTIEQETTINFYRDSDIATIYTSDNTMVTKLSKLVIKNPEVWKCYIVGGIDQPTGYVFETKKKYLSFREGKSNDSPRVLSQEHKEAMQKARELKKLGFKGD